MMRLRLPVIISASDYDSCFGDVVWRQAAAAICARHGLSHSALRREPQGENIIFSIDERLIVKIFAPFRDSYAREKAALEFFDGKLGIKTPAILYAGELEGWSYLVMTRLAGRSARETWPEMEARERVEIAASLGSILKRLHAYAAPTAEPALNRDWQGFLKRQAEGCVERQRACGANPEWLESLPGFVADRLTLLPPEHKHVLLHGDVHTGNLLLERAKGAWKITGLFDFGDSLCGFHEYDFVAPGVLMMQGDRASQREFLLAYGYKEPELDVTLRARLMLLTVLYECSDLRKYALRLRPEAVNFRLEELEAAIWRFAAQ